MSESMDIHLDTASDMDCVRALIAVIQDEPDKARGHVRALPVRDRAVLSFHLSELSRLIQEEEEFRTTADTRRAWVSHPSNRYPDSYDS